MNSHDIVFALSGIWHGTYGMVRCPCHNDRTPSLQIGEGQLGVIVHCWAGCDWRTVRDALARAGLLEPRRGISTFNRSPSPRSPHPGKELNAERAGRIWRASHSISGTLAAAYLELRGIALDGLPATLRFHPALSHPANGVAYPAMVAAVTVWPSREVRAVHRTYLKADGTGKIEHLNAKAMLGPCRGGAVRLSAPGPKLAIGEGLETCLSVLAATRLPTLAALSTSGLRGIVLPDPPLAGEVLICADADAPGMKAAHEAAKAFAKQGRVVRIATPTHGKDFNDTLRGAL